VDHYHGRRFDNDQRDKFNYNAQVNTSFNKTISTILFLPWYKKVIQFLYFPLVGDRGCPGVARLAWGAIKGEGMVLKKFVPTAVGYVRGIAFIITHGKGHRRDMS
jgi:hypothetical protein